MQNFTTISLFKSINNIPNGPASLLSSFQVLYKNIFLHKTFNFYFFIEKF
jgi:hypothetical protein